jgi:hypothetical protein
MLKQVLSSQRFGKKQGGRGDRADEKGDDKKNHHRMF